MKERSIGEDTVEENRRELQAEKILEPDFAAAVLARKRYKALRSLQANGFMTEVAEDFQVAAGTAAEIQDAKRRLAFELSEQSVAVLTDVMVACAFPETLRMAIVVRESPGGYMR